jgi:hypothetical protein
MNDIISHIIDSFFKPYPVCICNNFIKGKRLEDRKMYICGNCNGYMSYQRLLDDTWTHNK